MVLQKHRGASNQKSNIFRRQTAATNPTIATTRPAQPLTAIPIPSNLLPPLLQVSTTLPSTNNLPPTSSSTFAPYTTSSSTSAPPSASASPTSPIVAAITSTTHSPSTTTAATGENTNTGALVGAIVGGCAVLGLIAAGVYLLLRRRRQKKKRHNEALNTSDSRRSAALLDGGQEKQGDVQPLNRIARHVQNAPLPNISIYQQNHSASGYYVGEQGQYDDRFTTQPSRTAFRQGQYGAQPAAHAYPSSVNTHGYNDPHGYPPQAQYRPQPQFVAQPQQYDMTPSSHYTHSDTTLPFAQQYGAVPSPAHYAQSQTSLLHHPEPGTPSVTTAHDATSTVQDRHSMEDDEDAPPPAYEITETFVNHRPDVKTRHLTYDAASSISASGSAPTLASASTSAGPFAEQPSPFTSADPSAEPPLFSGPSRHHTLSSRPVSGTSAVTIVYE